MMRNIAWGFRCGSWFAAAYMVIAVVGYLTVSPDAIERQGISFGVVLLTYATAGPLSGAIVGLLRPLARARVGAMFVGIIAAVPMMTGLMIAFRGLPSAWSDPTEVLAIALASLLGGAATGYTLWEPWTPDPKEVKLTESSSSHGAARKGWVSSTGSSTSKNSHAS